MQRTQDHDLALSTETIVAVLSARPRADLEREVRSEVHLYLRRERATAAHER